MDVKSVNGEVSSSMEAFMENVRILYERYVPAVACL